MKPIKGKKTILANTFTPLYDELEDRIRIVVNYQDIQNRIDFVITRKNISHTIKLRAKIGKKVINTYRGDGLIISTPTGSTAYNLSSGGPMLYPMTPAFIVNPICPHSLTQRPLVLPSHFEIEIDTIDEEGGIIIIDGQEIYDLETNNSIKIKLSPMYIKLIHQETRDYFDVLKDKLNWGDE